MVFIIVMQLIFRRHNFNIWNNFLVGWMFLKISSSRPPIFANIMMMWWYLLWVKFMIRGLYIFSMIWKFAKDHNPPNFWPYCPIHVVTFTLISNLATNYIQKRRGEPGMFSFEYNLSPNLISKKKWLHG